MVLATVSVVWSVLRSSTTMLIAGTFCAIPCEFSTDSSGNSWPPTLDSTGLESRCRRESRRDVVTLIGARIELVRVACQIGPVQLTRGLLRHHERPVGCRSRGSATPHEAPRLAASRAARACLLAASSCSGTPWPRPQYISSGVCPRNAECGISALCAATWKATRHRTVAMLSHVFKNNHWCFSVRHQASIIELENVTSRNASTRESIPVSMSPSSLTNQPIPSPRRGEYSPEALGEDRQAACGDVTVLRRLDHLLKGQDLVGGQPRGPRPRAARAIVGGTNLLRPAPLMVARRRRRSRRTEDSQALSRAATGNAARGTG